MGIQGLLPFLANSTRDAHISEFENEFVAIDAYCWLHKGIYSCAFDLAMKKPTTKYVTYCMRYIEMLLHFKVKPILVFDGRQLASKSDTEKKRREERKRKYEKGKELIRAGKTQEGRKLLGESVDVTHELALNLIQKCQEKNIDCIVASYEADSQLAFLSIRDIVKCVITEDSDLLAYGCERVMFKMDTSGRGKLVEKNNIHFSLNMTPDDFSEDIFRYMCILSGCDYLPSLPSIGPANALKFIKMLKGNDIYDVLPKLPIYLNKMNVKVTSEYIVKFKVADNTFKHQLVYDPFQRSQVPLRPTKDDDDIVGTKLPDDLAFQLAIGNIDPITMKRVYNFDPDKFGKGFSILWRIDLCKTILKPGSLNSHSEAIEARKRQRENLEADAVQSVTNDLKKQRIPLYIRNITNFSAKKAVQKIPETGFIFEPIIPEQKKKVSNLVEGSEIFRSRYFSREKNKGREKKETNTTPERRKGESYEDYVQRLCNECFLVGESEDENEEPKDRCCEAEAKNMDPESFCSSCDKCPRCCTCFGETDSQRLGECIKQVEEFKNARKNSPQHFLLDEIYKSQNGYSEEKNLSEDDLKKTPEKNVKDNSPSESLTLNFTKMLSKLDNKDLYPTAKNSETVSSQKENSDECCEDGLNSDRAPSPVFKVHKETRVLSRNCKLGNVSDTTGTPTSVYFSSAEYGSLRESDPVFSRRTPACQRQMPSIKSFNSAPSKLIKNNRRNSAVNRTLFQFGFKKERRSEVDPETWKSSKLCL